MRSYAVVPPMMLDARQRKLRYINNNSLIEDPMAEYKERQYLNVWTPAERQIFKEKYLQHPKNFSLIAQYLERKVLGFLVPSSICLSNHLFQVICLCIFIPTF